MLTTIAALYVIVPALYALACVALAMRPVHLSEPASEAPSAANAVYLAVRDQAARQAVRALYMARTAPTTAAQRMWLDVAYVQRNRAEVYNAAIAA